MNETEKRILANQIVIMEALFNPEGNSVKSHLVTQIYNTEEALAPQSQEMGYEKDIQEEGPATWRCNCGGIYLMSMKECPKCSQSYPNKNEVKKE